MPINIDVFDFACFNQLRNGVDFNQNLSEFTPNLVGNVGEKVKVSFKASLTQSSFTESVEEWEILPAIKEIRRSSGSFLDDAVQVGDLYEFYPDWAARKTAASPEYSGAVSFIASNGRVLKYTVGSGTDSTNGVVTNVGLAFPQAASINWSTSLFLKFGVIGNDETFNYLSKTSGEQQTYYASGLGATGTVEQAEPLGKIRSWVSGAVTMGNPFIVSEFRGLTYEVTHEFILNPFYILSYREFIDNGTIPDLLAGDSSIKYAAELEFRKTLTDTGSSKIQSFDNLKGFVGWYGENFNGLNAKYKVASVAYEEDATGAPLDAVNINTPTKAVITIEGLAGAITDYSCSVYIFKVPDSEDDYIGTETDLLENFLFKSEIVSSPATSTPKAATSLVSGDLIIEYTIDYTVAEKLQLTTDGEYMLLVQVEDPTISAGNSDRLMLIADLKNYVDIDFLAGFVNVPKYDYLQHGQQLGDSSSSTQILSNEDGILLDAIIGADVTKGVIINSITLKLLAYNSVLNKSFDLDSFVFNLGDIVLASGVQQIEVDGLRGYSLAVGDEFNFAKITTGLQVGDFQQYIIQIGQKIKWQDWLFNAGVDNVFFDASQPNNNLNEKASNYSDEQGYVLKLALVVNVAGSDDLGRQVTGDFINYGTSLTIEDYSESEDSVTGVIQTFDLETGQSLEGNILYNGKDTLFKAIFQNAAGMQYGIHRIEPSQNQGEGILELSSVVPSASNNLLKPLDGETQLGFDIDVSELTTQCVIDGALIQEGLAYKLSARAAKEPFVLADPFAFTIDTTSPGTSGADQFQLPLILTGDYDFLIDKGNGDELIAVTVWDDPATLLDYSITGAGVYSVKIYGLIRGWSFNGAGDSQKVFDVSNWGTVDFSTTTTGVMYGCSNLTISAPDAPILGDAMQNFFRGCSSLTVEDFSLWDVSAVTTFNSLFLGCSSFNGNVSAWDVSLGQNFRQMFDACSSFNSAVGAWALTNANDLIQMFRGCTVFNQPLISWTFGGGSLSLTETFRNCRDFNQDVNWNITLSTVNQCFQNAESFNQDLTNWDVSGCISFGGTFREADAFNSNILNWDVSSGVDFALMFYKALTFNQNIAGWSFKITGSVSFANMFDGASLFNQNLAPWNVGKLTNANGMLQNTALSTANYDNLLNGWSGQSVNPGVPFGVGSIQYTIATSQAARGILTNAPNNWTITDGGGI